MTIYEGGNIYEFMWKDFQDFLGHWGIKSKIGTDRGGTIKSQIRKYETWRMKEHKAWEKKHGIKKEWLDGIFGINSWYYELKKEVRKKMAIDYKEEWEKLQRECGHLTIIKNGCVTLGYVMGNMIRDTIDKREKLMEQYIKEHMTTEIDGGDKGYHTVNVTRLRRSGGQSLLAKVNVGKKDFEYWCKKKEKGGK